jgi:chemotaxis protein CheD
MTAARTWVIAPPRRTFVVGVADMVASNDANADIITYSLGSCLGIAIYDPVKKVGGLLHIMLPDSKIDPVKGTNSPFMFVDTGVPRLFHSAYDLGADRSRLIVKVAGGAQLLDEKGVFNIGERNFIALKALFSLKGITMQAVEVGGVTSRTMRLDLSNGNVTIKSPGTNVYPL